MTPYTFLLLAHIFSVLTGTLLSWRMASPEIGALKTYRALLFIALATLFASGVFLYTMQSADLSHSPIFIIKIALVIALFASLMHDDRATRNIFLWTLIVLVSIGERSIALTIPAAILGIILELSARRRLSASLPATE